MITRRKASPGGRVWHHNKLERESNSDNYSIRELQISWLQILLEAKKQHERGVQKHAI